MERRGHPRGCGAPKGAQGLPWLHGQEPGAPAQEWAAAMSQDIETHIHEQHRGRCIPGASGAFPDASASPEAAAGAPALQPLSQHLPCPLSHQCCHSPAPPHRGGMQGEAQVTPSVAHGALGLPRSQPCPAQERSAKSILVSQCQEHLSELAGCLPGFKCCHSSTDPMTCRDENLSAGVVRKSLFFHVSTWLIPLSKVVFY